ncbi:NfeD family protein [Ohtaekwangia koreensis]|uniref:NfeD-like C-terminal, partner-binding n=1 Tax=Ohtaekwangia koreensis TaxID=688867 RepID=A0A1T5ILN0_9BACT|nr:NfeD family protein [Ohtaekwangia koreensis]SKC40076.1 NfeD-like C-terminal, partner-binding [Ohtaekwangia koreensis]
MLMWIIILALLLIGLGLIIVELVFIPGTTVVGLLGLIFTGTGVIISYNHFGSDVGFYVLISTLVTTLIALFYSFRTGAWTRFSLKSSSDSKVNEGILNGLHIGDEGITISTLRPIGKAEFGTETFEVKTLGNYVEQGQRVKITQIYSNQIVVEPIN